MSQSDSFIDEVTEEVRRERLFGYFRRWAWLAILLVVVVVGLASWNEWRKSREVQQARALGDAVVAALDGADAAARAAALARIDAEGSRSALVNMLAAAEGLGAEAGDPDAAALFAAAGDAAAQARWDDLARLKSVLLEADSLPPQERIERLDPLTAAGAPYRLLALEATALARVELGERDVALAIFRDILADGEVTEGLRGRASQMIVALGGEPEPA